MQEVGFSRATAALVLIGGLVVAGPAAAAGLRPLFDVTLTRPQWFDHFDRGYGFGLGFMAQQSSRSIILFRAGFDRVEGVHEPLGYPQRVTDDTFTWSVGGRYEPWPRRLLRPYGALEAGVRLGIEVPPVFRIVDGRREEVHGLPEANGIVVAPKLGVSVGAPELGSLYAETGLEFVAANPDRYGVVQVRVGVCFAGRSPGPTLASLPRR